MVSADDEADGESDGEEVEDADDEVGPLTAYKKFMIGVMKLLVNSTDPTIKVESFNAQFERAATIVVQFSDSISKVSTV